MAWFRRRTALWGLPPEDVRTDSDAPEQVSPAAPPPPEPERIQVSRTLVKSEPELAALVAGEPRLAGGSVEVRLTEKGFGTRVVLTAGPDADLGEAELEGLLDELAEPRKRPFTNA
jgi:hypothetical protein